MNHRRTLTAAAVLALGVGGAGTAVAAKSAAAPASVTVKGIGTPGSFKINRYATDGTRYDRDTYTVRSGGTLKFINEQAEEGPHTITILRRSKLPHTDKAINECEGFAKSSPCTAFIGAHQADPKTGKIGKPVVDVNRSGLDGPGDSFFVDPKGAPTSTRTMKVSAKAGSTLYFICLVHPWMQAKLLVK